MTNQPKINFIVPLFNNPSETQAMLQSLFQTITKGIDHKILLIDDYSTDGTRDWLGSLDHPKLEVILNESNLGFARANNRAAKKARADILCFLNNDLILGPGWLEPMLEILLSPELNAGIVGNLQYRVIDGELDHAGVDLNYLGQPSHIKIAPHPESRHKKVFAVTGACCLMWRADFESLGGFNESYLNGVEDIELCMGIKRMGKHCYVASQSRVQHHVSLSRDRVSAQNEKNSRLFFARWRKELKQVMASDWSQRILHEAHQIDDAILDGELSPVFLENHASASLLIAENLLRRHELRWERELDKKKPNDHLVQLSVIKGLQNVDPQYALMPHGYCEFKSKGLRGARNFYICGYRRAGAETPGVELVIDVNGIQFKRFSVEKEQSINFGIREPLILPGITNVFEIRIERGGNIVTDRSILEKIAITHFVIDDHHIPLPI